MEAGSSSSPTTASGGAPLAGSKVEIRPEWVERCTVDRRHVDELSCEAFVDLYEKPGRPLIIEGWVPRWAAATEWTKARLLDRFADVEFRVSARRDWALKDFVAYAERCESGDEAVDRPEYLFEKDFARKCPGMGSEFSIPPYFCEDLMAVLGEERPDYRWLIAGPRGSGSSFHVDPNANYAWNATICGAKKWVLYPPDRPPPMDAADDHQRCLSDWFRAYYSNDPHAAYRAECVTRAGDLLYVPRGWWHCVLNIEFSVALAHNVVDRHNLLAFLNFLQESALSCGRGSGCRGQDAFDFKGDVPTSVVFPSEGGEERRRQRNDEALEEEKNFAPTTTTTTMTTSKESESSEPRRRRPRERHDDGLPCACSRAQAKLAVDFTAALARDRPGLVDALKAEKAAQSGSTWAKLGLVKGRGLDDASENNTAAPRPTFAFNFDAS